MSSAWVMLRACLTTADQRLSILKRAVPDQAFVFDAPGGGLGDLEVAGIASNRQTSRPASISIRLTVKSSSMRKRAPTSTILPTSARTEAT